MTSINFKVIGLTRPGFENCEVWIRSCVFGFPNLPEQEADALLIRPPRLVQVQSVRMCVDVCVYACVYGCAGGGGGEGEIVSVRAEHPDTRPGKYRGRGPCARPARVVSG